MKATQKTDYKNYDYIDVSVKNSRAQEFLDMYETFGWEEISREARGGYDDVLNVSFRRPHAVPAKDELQFLQVCAENEFNLMDKLENVRHAEPLTVGICFGGIGCALIAVGLTLAIILNTVAFIVAGCVLSACGLGLAVLAAVAARTLMKSGEKRCAEQCAIHEKNIRDICAQVLSLRENGR